ncbi:Non-structural maintenance of chromosome element 4 [Suillus paluster]|uniref:Non-structural maintenance of chromosome element 4 n=1 Tax=Suillus paluster TaxID=48578 RepID=UPI001B86FFA7|nr:Non-structural maintenance of chromosome element 4 [Suillus paluster]KAG1734449.1 Non-structural maintenance of chromosome element 4 [Suillus paluster]
MVLRSFIQIRRIVCEEVTINLFNLVINPHSFGQLVENIYYLTILINNGICGMDLTEDQEPVILVSLEYSFEGGTGGIDTNHQQVLEFDIATWRRAIQVFNITHSVIPHRL